MQDLDTINLAKGSPAPELLPLDLLTASFDTLRRSGVPPSSILDYGSGAGDIHVRQVVAEWLSRRYMLPQADTARVSVTGGASQNIACILQCYTSLDYTQNIYVVAPTYHFVCDVFEDHGFAGRLRAIPEDEQGLDIDFLEDKMGANSSLYANDEGMQRARPHRKLYRSIIYCVPSFSNPSGMTMTKTRREQLVRLARRHNALIVSDDVYDFLNWGPGPPLPRLTDIDVVLDGGPADHFGNTVSNGTFSKLLGPGLRTGWAEGTPDFINGLSMCGSSVSGGPPSQLTSWLAAEAITSGKLDAHIDNVLKPVLQRKSQALLHAVRTLLIPLGVEPCTANDIDGGYFVGIRLPPHVESSAFCEQTARKKDLLLAPGKLFAVHGDEELVHGRSFIRLCFAYEPEDRLVEAVKRMADVLETWS